jgi:Amt family ammonium transporter
VTGIFYGMDPGLGQLGAQALGVLTIWTVIFGIAFAFFKIQNAVMKGGIRPSAEMEIEGMDIPEMGALAYPEFEPFVETEKELAVVGGPTGFAPPAPTPVPPSPEPPTPPAPTFTNS